MVFTSRALHWRSVVYHPVETLRKSNKGDADTGASIVNCTFIFHRRNAFVFRRCYLNTLRPRQNGRHFTDNIFKCIFLNKSVCILIKISLKFVPKGPIDNIPALVQIMAWRRPGDKPLSEPMIVRVSSHICVTRPQ